MAFVIAPASAQGTNAADQALPHTPSEVERLLRETTQDRGVVRRSEAATRTSPPPPGDRPALMRYLLDRAQAARRVGQYEQVQRDLEQVLANAERGSGEQIFALLILVDVHGSRGDLQARDAAEQRLLEAAPRNSGAALYALMHYMLLQVSAGDLRGGRATMASVEENFRSLRAASPSSAFSTVWISNYEFARGVLAVTEGRYSEGADAFRRALHELQTNPKVFNSVSAQTVIERGWNVGPDAIQVRLVGALRAQDRLVEAEALGREALVTAARIFGGQSVRAGDALLGLSATLFTQGRYGEARILSDQALERFRAVNAERTSFRVIPALTRNAICLTYEERWAEADKVFAERARLIADLEARKTFGPDEPPWAIALARLGHADRAVPMARRMLQAWEKRFDPGDERIAMARGIYAITLARSGNRDGALRAFRASVPALLDRERAGESDEGNAVWRVQLMRWILEDYLGVLATARDPASVDEAFRIADVARASGVQRALAASAARESFSDAALTQLAREEQDLANRVRALSETLANVLERSSDPKIVAELRAEIESARTARRKVRAGIAQRFPDYAQLLDPKPLSIAEARDQLGEGEALVSIYAAEERTYVWGVRNGRAPAFAAIDLPARQLAQKVKRLRRALDPGEIDPRSFPVFDVALAHELYQTLFTPVESVLEEATHLIVVPHGALGQINASLLVTSPGAAAGGTLPLEGYRHVAWLLRKAPVSQLPSVAALASLRRVPSPPANRVAFAGFGDPAYGGAQPAAGATRGATLRSARRNAGEASEVKANWTNEIAKLAPLPDTRAEILEIAQMLSADGARDVRVGAAATETAVKQADLSRHRVIAFATHGLVPGDLQGLTQPALALSNPKMTGERNADGLLTLGEILTLKLNADWVILSACNTGAADGEGSEAVSGLGRGFFFAGARALLVSNWPVESVSARLLTTGIFRHQAQTPNLSRAEALRRSMLDVLDRGVASAADGKPAYSYAHPLFWAPFSLVGDGR